MPIERNNVASIRLKPNPTLAHFLHVVSIVLVVAFSIDAAPAVAQIPSAAALGAEIDAKGAREVVDRLWNSPQDANGENDWSRVTEQMWKGRAAYIALAPKLAPGTDAGAAEELGISLAHALPLTPATVLRAIDPKDGPVLGVSQVCSVPFIEDTVKDIPAYIRAAQSSVNKVTSPELQAIRAACLKQLEVAAKPSTQNR